MPGRKPRNETAVHRMTRSFPKARLGATIQETRKSILKKAKSLETINYIYVVDDEDALKGVVSLRELLSAPPGKKTVDEIMARKPVAARSSTDQERLVYLALSKGVKEIPILDKGGRLLGVVPHDKILEVFNQEVREDILKFGGVFHKVGKEVTRTASPASSILRARLPWLVIGVLGGAVAASIVASFESILGSFLLLAAFIPVLVYLSGAVGAQSQALIIRSLAVDPKFPAGKYLSRELKVAIALATICGLLLGAIALVVWGSPLLGMILAASVAISLLATMMISTLLPIIFNSAKIDPAVSVGPLATLSGDLVTIIVYFLVASAFISHFGV